jgi:MtrB/PioB family decaheme-associated outer membrane protein
MRRLARAGIIPLAAAALLSFVPSGAEEKPAAATPEEPADENHGQVEGEVVFGPQYFAATTNRDSNKFEEYRDVPNGFVIERFDFLFQPNPHWYLDIAATDVMQRDVRLNVQFGRIDLWKGTVRWSENPREWTDQAYQLFAESQRSVFTLVDPLQAAIRAAPASVDADGDLEWDPGTKGFIIKDAIAQGAQPVEVGHQRKVGGASFEYTPTRHWTFTLDANRERRKGTAPQTLGMYFSQAPAEVAAPIDFKTDMASIGGEYTSKMWNAGVRLTQTDFNTGRTFLQWDDQLFLVDEAVNVNQANPGRSQMSQAVNYDATQFSLFGGVNLPMHTRIDASFTEGQTTQDDPFLPMTINSLLTPAPLPATTYDGEHRTRAMRVNVFSRPTKSIRWGAWFRSYELDNRSPSLTFTDYVAADYQFPLCGNVNTCDANGDTVANDRISRRSLPYGYKRDSLGAMFGWSPVHWFSGSVSYERESFDRKFSAVESSDEDIAKLTLDFTIAEWLTARTTLRHQERKADHYDAAYFEQSFPIGEPAEAEANEGMRRFYWTDRDRDNFTFTLDATPIEWFGIYAEAAYWKNEYSDPNTGLAIGQSYTSQEDRNFDGIPETYDILLAGRTRDRSTSYSLGFTATASERVHLYLDYTWDTWKYGLETRYRNVAAGIGTDDPLDNWGSNVDDKYNTASVGLDAELAPQRKWWLALDASWSKGTGDIETHFVPGGASSGDTTLTAFPQLATTLAIAQLAVHHEIRKNLGYQLRYWYESWKEDNFASDFNQPYMGDPDNDPGSDKSIFLGLDFKNYTNHIVSVMLNYSF